MLYAVDDRSKRVSAIFTFRSDFLGATQKHPLLNQSIAAQGYFVAAMNKDGLSEAITKPAESEGYSLDLSTVDLLIEQTADREGALPLLQFALTQIWEGLKKGQEPAETLKAIGGVGGALAGEAQRIFEGLTTEEQEIARRVFLALVQLGEGTKDTRRRIALDRVVSHRNSLEQVQRVIDRFASPGKRLITLADDDGKKTVEVTHEALFDNWQQLKDWLDGGRSDLRFQRRLDDAVMVWQENGKPDGNLWRSPDLDLLRRYQERAGEDLTPLQLEFFQASIDYEDARKQAEERQLQADRDLAQERLRTAEIDKELAEERLRAEKRKKQIRLRELVGFAFALGMVIFIIINMYLSQQYVDLNKKSIALKDQYEYCPKEKGRPGTKIKDVCFRDIKTSGKLGVFLSSTNFHLDRGIEAFKKGEYKEAERLFNQAIDSDPKDPIPRIFRNNAKARLSNKEPLKLAVVVSIDYYETAAKDVLRGVADAQDEFNENLADTDSFLEIVIANDENEEEAAKKVARELVNDSDILGIIGHHASESTIAAQTIYKLNEIAVISPTSSSSKLDKDNNFFRTVGGTKKSAKLYTSYITKEFGLDSSITVFYVKNSDYSKVLKDNIKVYFNKKGGIIKEVEIRKEIDIEEEIEKGFKSKDKALLIISNVKTNSVAIAISKKNFRRPEKERMKLISAMSLSEEETIEKGGDAVEGMILVRPCLAPLSEQVMKKWQLKNEINWRHSSSYDATQAFIKAIKQSEPARDKILRKLSESKSGSLSFHLDKKETSGFGLKWDRTDHSNANQDYCVVRVEEGKFKEIAKIKNGKFGEIRNNKFIEIDSTISRDSD